ncbi:5-oxoprolinase subunit PxpB [Alginatibacterium sediminis]|uniref:5-oxoprolinase subunit PxpB n=1 Tax=Alginatibacterium sediminis TaxID=2164068 RepID=A0A420EBW3_9ALTE|nr:5-oxoprolinase subunit PxpB [Alginatibacterium sediminis]
MKPVSESAFIIYFGDHIDLALPQLIARVKARLEQLSGFALIECIASYTTLLVEYHPLKISAIELHALIESALRELPAENQVAQGKCIELPTYYSLQSGPDLALIAKAKGLSIEHIISIHSQQRYTVCAIGFAPGFAFLASVDKAIQSPRHHKPRMLVPAGSVGIADQQTAVYPTQSPGGWNIIGNCPLPLFDPSGDPITPFSVGDSVQFNAIDFDDYVSLGGQICWDWRS